MNRRMALKMIEEAGLELVPGRMHDRVVDPATGKQVALMSRGSKAFAGYSNRNIHMLKVAVKRKMERGDS